jgi:hypothetical protein
MAEKHVGSSPTYGALSGQNSFGRDSLESATSPSRNKEMASGLQATRAAASNSIRWDDWTPTFDGQARSAASHNAQLP